MPATFDSGDSACLPQVVKQNSSGSVPLEAADYHNTILVGDARTVLAQVPANSVDCCVTSPPYFGQRQYAEAAGGPPNPAEIGREDSVEVYIQHLVELFQAVRRVMKNDATLWLNLGDKYEQGKLLGVPWRVALALQEVGWQMRSDIIWHKPNAMPSSTRRRPTVDHEYLFLLSLSDDYYYQADAIREPHVTFSEASKMRGGRNHFGKRGGTPEQGKNQGKNNLHDARWDQAFHEKGRNKRTVWSIPLGKCRDAHFAVFPEKLIEPCIRAGSPLGGLVLDPFLGSGTTGLVARRLGRNYLGCELIPKYAEMAKQRIQQADILLPEFQ